ncbi:MAG: sigma-70 family RNA polymerase sigma factor [Chloroflexota bacterium]|nr:sigma-70 family RNA polymerase sigma factor [Chloroflexota bacterium]
MNRQMDAANGIAIESIATRRAGVNERSFADFYSAHRDAVYRGVLVATRNPQRAEDAVQEAFMRAYDRWETVREHERPRAWVARVALNVATSWWRRHGREQANPPDRPAPPDVRPMDADLVRLVWALPERQRQVVALRVLADLSVADTAAALAIAEGTVKATLHRALGRLRAGLEADGAER